MDSDSSEDESCDGVHSPLRPFAFAVERTRPDSSFANSSTRVTAPIRYQHSQISNLFKNAGPHADLPSLASWAPSDSERNEMEPSKEMEGTDATRPSEDVSADTEIPSTEDVDTGKGARRKVRRKASKIARPRDSMPGFKKRSRGERGSRSGGNSMRRGRRGAVGASVGRSALDRRLSKSAYFGGASFDDSSVQINEEPSPEDFTHMLNTTAQSQSRMTSVPAKTGTLVVETPKCFEHGIFCVLLKVKRDGPNKGRHFFKCAKEKVYEQCSYFLWADEVSKATGNQEPGVALQTGDAWVTPELSVVPPPVFDNVSPSASDGCPFSDEILKQVMVTRFGYQNFRSGQLEVIRNTLGGKSCLGVLPTGAGKSLCYQMHAALRPGVVVVVTPLVSLMVDQVASLPSFLPGVCIRSGGDSTFYAAESALTKGNAKVLYVSPERLFSSRFQALLKRAPKEFVSLLVIDEAHCISQMGHNFRSAYLRMRALIKEDRSKPECEQLFCGAPIMALTATAPPDVCADVCASLDIEQANVVVAAAARTNLQLTVSRVRSDLANKADALCRRLQAEPFCGIIGKHHGTESSDTTQVPAAKRSRRVRFETAQHSQTSTEAGYHSGSEGHRWRRSGAIIVYVSKQRDCESVCNYLRTSRIVCRGTIEMYHAGLDPSVRANTQNAFLAGNVSVLVATIAFGMGLDCSLVRGVIHFDIPFSVEAYVQEIGRAGRDGQPAACHLMLSDYDEYRILSRAHADGADATSTQVFISQLFSKANTANSQQSDKKVSGCRSTEPNVTDECTADTVAISMSVRHLERNLDVRVETAETICAYLETTVPGFRLQQSTANGLARVRFYSGAPSKQRLNSGNSSEAARFALDHLLKYGKSSNGTYTLDLYEHASSPCQVSHIYRGLQDLKKDRSVGVEFTDPRIVVQVRRHCIPNVGALNILAAKCNAVLLNIECHRRRKANILLRLLHESEAMLSDSQQSEFLHNALQDYFAKPMPDGELTSADQHPMRRRCDSVAAYDDHLDRCRRAAEDVLLSSAYGHTVPRRARQVARILHGISSPAFSAKDWHLCHLWGRFVHVDYRAVLRIAADVVRKDGRP